MLPRFRYCKKLIDVEAVQREHGFPRGDDRIYFPTVLEAHACLADPIARYYLYASPHDHKPGCGIGLWTADRPAGPWTFQRRVIANRQATPSVLFHPERGTVLIYSHYPNGANHIDESDDGVSFRYRGRLGLAPRAHGYGSVFRYAFPDGETMYCAIFWMGLREERPALHPYSALYVSPDGYGDWRCLGKDFYPPADVFTGDEDAPRLANNPEFVRLGEERYVFFHAPRGIWAYRVDACLRPVAYAGLVFTPAQMPAGLGADAVTSPFLLRGEDGVWNLLFGAGTAGERIDLHLARADDGAA